MGNRKYAEVILPVIKSQAKTINQMVEKLGKTKLTISTYITDCRNRGHNITKTMRDGVAVYRYVTNEETAPMPKVDTFKDPEHIENRVYGKTKFIAKTLTDRLGFTISTQQAVLYGLHLADQKLNPHDFDD